MYNVVIRTSLIEEIQAFKCLDCIVGEAAGAGQLLILNEQVFIWLNEALTFNTS